MEKKPLPFKACLLGHIVLGLLLVFTILLLGHVKVNERIMMTLNGNHHSLIAVVTSAYRDTCPLCQVLWSSCIAIIPSSIQKDWQLDLNRKLWIVGIVVEDMVILNEINNLDKDLIQYSKLALKEPRIIQLPHIKKLELWNLDRMGMLGLKNLCQSNFIFLCYNQFIKI